MKTLILVQCILAVFFLIPSNAFAVGQFPRRAKILFFPSKLKIGFNKTLTPREQYVVAHWMENTENLGRLLEFQGDGKVLPDIFTDESYGETLRRFFSLQFGPFDEDHSERIGSVLTDFRSYLEKHPKVLKGLEDGENFSTALTRLIDREAFESWLNFLWLRGDRNIFLKFWDVREIRDEVFLFY